MKPAEKKPARVFRIINRANGQAVGSYSRTYCDEYDFNSVREARTANYHGEFEKKKKYSIAEYEVTYKLINPDCDKEEPDSVQQKQKQDDDEAIEKLVADGVSRQDAIFIVALKGLGNGDTK